MKLPAYGKPLLERRRAGDHPLEVALIFGRDWHADVAGLPRLAIIPEHYAPGVYDFRCAIGLKIVLYDQELWAAEVNENVRPYTFGVFYDLLAELARVAAPVEIRWPAHSGWIPMDVFDLALNSCGWERTTRRAHWPRWWSDEIEADYRRRWTQWAVYDAVARGILDGARAETA